MAKSTVIVSLLARLPISRHSGAQSSYIARRIRHASSLPRIASPSLWKSMIPKAFRQPTPLSEAASPPQKRNPKIPLVQNPATHLTVLGLICGSLAIQVITLRAEIEDSRRMVESKIRLLDNVIRRLRSGESVDVREALGTGDPEKEAEWAKVIEEIGDASKWIRESKTKKQQYEPQTEGMELDVKTAALPRLDRQTVNGVPKPVFH